MFKQVMKKLCYCFSAHFINLRFNTIRVLSQLLTQDGKFSLMEQIGYKYLGALGSLAILS